MNWYTTIKEANQDSFLPSRYYHGSMKYLEPGTILKPSDDYENDWQMTSGSEGAPPINAVFSFEKLKSIFSGGLKLSSLGIIFIAPVPVSFTL